MTKNSNLASVTRLITKDERTQIHNMTHVCVPRDWHQEIFHEMLEKLGCDSYGIPQEETFLQTLEVPFDESDPNRHLVVDTPLFTLRPYYWGENRDIMILPNFTYKPWDYNISWYKWPMRGAYANFQLDDKDWTIMLKTIEDVCARKPTTETEWLEGVDDFPRMTETQYATWLMQKHLTAAENKKNEFEDLLYTIAMYVPIENEKLKDDLVRTIGISPDELARENKEDN